MRCACNGRTQSGVKVKADVSGVTEPGAGDRESVIERRFNPGVSFPVFLGRHHDPLLLRWTERLTSIISISERRMRSSAETASPGQERRAIAARPGFPRPDTGSSGWPHGLHAREAHPGDRVRKHFSLSSWTAARIGGRISTGGAGFSRTNALSSEVAGLWLCGLSNVRSLHLQRRSSGVV